MRVLFVTQQIDYEPQGIMLLSSSLKAAGHEVELAIAAYRDPLAVAQSFEPHVVAYSVITGSQRYYLALNRRLKAAMPNVFSVFGGPHPTFFPDMVREDGVDAICRGEGEKALVELVNVLASGDYERLLSLANWCFWRNGKMIMNPVRPYLEDLDSLPMADRALVYERDPVTARSKIKYFITGRGCPYDCTYCFNHAEAELYRGKGKRVRQRSVANVIAELRWVRERYPLDFVIFVDDTFGMHMDWLTEFAEVYAREIGLPFFCNLRANLATPERVRLLKQAGCHSVSMGVETGDDRLREDLLKRHMSREQMLQAARLLHEAGLYFSTTNIIGLPTTTLDDDFKTLELNIQLKPAYAHVFIFQPYPRTELGEFTRQHGWVMGTFDDMGEVAWDHSILAFPTAHKRGLEVLQRLFALGVEWPRLVPLIRWLLKVPNNPLFWLLHKLWKGWALKKRVHPVHLSLSETIQTAWHFLRIKS